MIISFDPDRAGRRFFGRSVKRRLAFAVIRGREEDRRTRWKLNLHSNGVNREIEIKSMLVIRLDSRRVLGINKN